MKLLRALDCALTAFVNELFPYDFPLLRDPADALEDEIVSKGVWAAEPDDPAYNAIRELQKAFWCFRHDTVAGDCGCAAAPLTEDRRCLFCGATEAFIKDNGGCVGPLCPHQSSSVEPSSATEAPEESPEEVALSPEAVTSSGHPTIPEQLMDVAWCLRVISNGNLMERGLRCRLSDLAIRVEDVADAMQ